MKSMFSPAILLVLIVLVMSVTVPWMIQFYTDLLWARQVGYEPIFLKSIWAEVVAGTITFAVVLAWLSINLRIALRSMGEPHLVGGIRGIRSPFQPRKGPLMVIDSDDEPPQESLSLTPTQVQSLAWGGTLIFSVFSGLLGASRWLEWLQAFNAVPFGDTEPVFGRDAGFYVFQLPVMEFLQGLLFIMMVVTLAGCTVIYFQAGAMAIVAQAGLKLKERPRRHLGLLAAVFFLTLGFGAYLRQAHLLVTPSGILYGVAYVDAQARVFALYAVMGASLVGAALAAYQGFSRTNWPIAAGVGLYVFVLFGGQLYATAIQRFVVTPNEQVKELPYIVQNIESTRKAFALDRVEERELSGDETLTRADIEANQDTIRNVRLWDHRPLLDTFGQIQEIRTYYEFVSVDNDRYIIDGEYRQIMLSARELSSQSLPNRTWVNERLTFTHGYGIALGPVNRVTEEGLPVLFIKNLPPESSVDLQLTQPSIYYGELTQGHVFVKTRAKEFHYPKGDDNVYQSYEGDGGVPIAGFFRKLMFSARFGSLKMLLSNDFTDESRVIFRRNITERVRAIAPFLRLDPDPYLVVSEGRLYWILDAYTSSRLYPYSTPATRDINYIRNSVKIVIDAYHGKIDFYLAEPKDPIAQTISKIYPGLFRPLDQMPSDLRAHVRYPEFIFRLQTQMYATYHMTNPAVFYNKEDQWDIPTIEVNRASSPMEPYYTIMRLPGEEEAEFIQMLPYTPRSKDNLAAWMVARSDGEHYGRLLVFQFPKQKVVFGPRQVISRINQDQEISPQITLWNQQGSEVIQGTLLVVPIEESLLYIRPLYLRSAGGRIPELKRVVVAYQNQIVMESSLEDALERLFGPPGPGGDKAESSERTRESTAGQDFGETGAQVGFLPSAAERRRFAVKARDHYQAALKAQRAGDWAQYGDEISKVGQLIEKLVTEQHVESPQVPSEDSP